MADSRHKPSKRFADSPKDIIATASLYTRPDSEKLGYTIPQGFKIRRYPAKRAAGAETWRQKGGMMGGSSGSCRGATSGNGIGVVPQAFVRP